MAKYGTFVYGSNTPYGTGAAGPQPTYNGNLLWVLQVDWGSGYINESANLIYPCWIERGKEYWISRNGNGLESTQPGRCSLTLDNVTRRYDTYNLSSPLYPNVGPNKKLRLSVKDLASGITYPVFTGWITNIIPNDLNSVTVEAVDDLEMLNRNDANIETMFKSTVSEGLRAVLSSLGMNASGVDDFAQPLQVFAADAENALGVVNELANASLGNIFIDRNGIFRYYAYTRAGSWTDIDQADVSKVIKLAQPWEELRNDVTVYANGYVSSAIKVIWAASGDVVVPSGGSLTIDATWSGICQPIAPVAGTDYDNFRYLTGLGGSWVSAFSASLSNVTAKGCTITISNGSPYPVGTKLQIRGREYLQSYTASKRAPDYYYNPQPNTSETVSTKRKYTEVDTSVPQYQRAKFVLDSRYLHDGNFAGFYAGSLKIKLKDGTKNPQFSIRGRWALQFGLELLDRVHFTSSTRGVDEVYRLGKVRHEWMSEGGQDVMTSMWLIDPFYSATVPDAEPIPETPPEIPGGGTGGDDPGLPPSDGGLTNCKFDAPGNGPYSIPSIAGEFTAGTVNSLTGSLPCIIRPVGYTNPTRYEFDAYSSYGSMSVAALLGVKVFSGPNEVGSSTPGQTGTGHFSGTFTNSAQFAVDNWALTLSSVEDTANYPGLYSSVHTYDAGANVWNDFCIVDYNLPAEVTVSKIDFQYKFHTSNGSTRIIVTAKTSGGSSTILYDAINSPAMDAWQNKSISFAPTTCSTLELFVGQSGGVGQDITGWYQQVQNAVITLTSQILISNFTVSNICPK